jgi:uncharacterized surface protein with fasciclin (FAS1) repeats
MTRSSRVVARASAVLALTMFAAVSPTSLSAQHASRNAPATSPSIPQVAKNAGVFGTLLAAVDAAGLTETLLGRGPFTLFAPTDDAFSRLPANTVRDLLKPENREQLRTLLTYHVVAGRVTAAQARTVRSANTVAGPSLRISESNGDLRINDATVRIADVPASNGIVHVIDRVLIPTESGSSNDNSATTLIDYAIDRGAPLYNDGQPSATVAVYEVAITALLAAERSSLSAGTQRELRDALRESRTNARERATVLRRALDSARRDAGGRMTSAR